MRSLASLLILLSASPLFAAPSGLPNPQPRKLLSKAELRVCLQREQELARRSDVLLVAQEAHMESSAQLSAEAMALSQVLRNLNSADEAAVDAYNKRIDARNAAVDIHNKRSDALNASQAELQSDEADYVAACVSRPFLRRDEDALLKELGIRQRPSQREKERPTRPTPGRAA